MKIINSSTKIFELKLNFKERIKLLWKILTKNKILFAYYKYNDKLELIK